MITKTKTRNKIAIGTLEYPRQLTQPGDSNTKLRKSTGTEYETIGLSLSPHRSAGIGNNCTDASPGCVATCLDGQGLASVFKAIQEARIKRTLIWHSDRKWFIDKLKTEISSAERKASKRGKQLAARLNVFSDILWESQTDIMESFPSVQFYDYSKHPARFGLLRPNYWITFSRSELNEPHCLEVLQSACNVAVVFADEDNPRVANRSGEQELPLTWNGYDVIDGDKTDLRFDDTRGRKHGRVVGLKLKAHSWAERAKAIASGFAVTFNPNTSRHI